MSDEELMAELENSFGSSNECDERIACSIEEMKQEIDRLLFKIRELEGEETEKVEETSEINGIDPEPNQE